MRTFASATVALWLATGPARADDDHTVDVRAATYAQVTRQAFVPGANGVVAEPQSVAALYGSVFLRVGNVDVPWSKDSLSGELSAWGTLGALPRPQGHVGDGDVQAAWVQHATKRFWVKLGRQVTLPGAARYVCFDGGDFGLRIGPVEVDAYVGVMALPRFGWPRGYVLLGSFNDALKSPTFLEAQAQAGQWLLGARVSWVGPSWLKGSLGFHEQQGADGLAYRNLSADVSGSWPGTFSAGGRLVIDLAATRPAEARLWIDVTKLEKAPISVDYGFAAPSLLLPHASVLAAFGGASWHELGAEATWQASPTHAAIACAQCHVVPERTEAPGHNDTDGPAELIVGALAALDGGTPGSDATALRCSGVYCHGYAATQPWNAPRSSDEACGSCHGLPPPSPHPQSANCHACHGTVTKPDRTFLNPAVHVDGRVQTGALACNSCHGESDAGAPPPSLDGGTSREQLGVGAHQSHLRDAGIFRVVECSDCHPVPAQTIAPGHANGTVELVFSGPAIAGGATPTFDGTSCANTTCHKPDALRTGGTSTGGTHQTPVWTRVDGSQVNCYACHGFPPPAPHPQMFTCETCHQNYEGGGRFSRPELHVNGSITFATP